MGGKAGILDTWGYLVPPGYPFNYRYGKSIHEETDFGETNLSVQLVMFLMQSNCRDILVLSDRKDPSKTYKYCGNPKYSKTPKALNISNLHVTFTSEYRFLQRGFLLKFVGMY